MPRRHKVLIAVLLLAGVLIVGGLALLAAGGGDGGGGGGGDALHRALDDALLGERYSADLTQGHGDFTAFEDASSASSYGPEGYVLVAKDDVPALRGVQTNGTHSSLGVRITTRSETPAGEFGFGPFCWHGMAEGYGFLVSNDGRALLVEPARSDTAAFRTVRSRPIDPIDWSRWHELRLDCSVTGAPGSTSRVALRGFLDGERVVRATSTVKADQLAYTGFGGVNIGDAPATWTVRSFQRLGADDIGPNR